MASYCPRWKHELQPPSPLSNPQERGRANKDLRLHLGNTSWKLHASPWLNLGHKVTLTCKEWWKTYLFQATLDSVTMGVSIYRKERAGYFTGTLYISSLWFCTVIWKTLETCPSVVTSDPDNGHHVNGRTISHLFYDYCCYAGIQLGR